MNFSVLVALIVRDLLSDGVHRFAKVKLECTDIFCIRQMLELSHFSPPIPVLLNHVRSTGQNLIHTHADTPARKTQTLSARQKTDVEQAAKPKFAHSTHGKLSFVP